MRILIVKGVEPDLHRSVKARAAAEGKTLRRVVIDLLRGYARGTSGSPSTRRATADAVLRAAGSVRVKGLASRIDEELYG